MIRFTQQRSGVIEPTSSRRIFSGSETHAIVLMDDDINSMENVVNTLVRVIGISEKQSINFMVRVHKEGIAIVWAGARSESEHYLQNLRESGLRCFLIEIVHHNF
nr:MULTISPECIES: ATP-dependent Clp protease adaptor ClpS [unclassified Leptolyngbya]